MSERRQMFYAGDVVMHLPTSERWSLAVDEEGGRVLPEGWPETRAAAKDCALIEAASEALRLEQLKVWAAIANGETDERVRAARRQLEREGVTWE